MITISKLRAEFIRDMNLQGIAAHTQRVYINGVKGLAKFYNKSPDVLTDEEVREYRNARGESTSPQQKEKAVAADYE